MAVDADDVGDTLTKALGEAPLAAADVQRMLSVVRERLQDDGVIVDVVVPGLDPVDPPTDGMGDREWAGRARRRPAFRRR